MVEKQVASARHALTEQKAAERLLHVDPMQDYTVYGVSFTPSKNGKTTIQMPHGGVALSQFVDAVWLLPRSKQENVLERSRSVIRQFKDQIPLILPALRALIDWMPTLHTAGLTHSDIQPSNLLWDGSRVRLIDWGTATMADAPSFDDEQEADIDGLETVFEEIKAGAASVYQKGGRRRLKTRKSSR